MRALRQQLAMSLRLYFRNTMALIYGYLFPTIFLVAFWVLYRYDRVPLIRHIGELLTVTVLGGACFGLPTTLVSERERGVWRRYRLTPVATGNLVASSVLARYAILITAGLLQLALAMALGMPFPRHPLELFVAFTAVSFAFLGLGLVIATMADTVPAVQALGQCIFLPMLIIGGVAVPLSSLPDWALHLSAFFPGRYAVEALQACVSEPGLGAARFGLAALAVIGAAGCLAGAKLFRWDAQQRFVARRDKGWVAAALAAWIAVGVAAESRGRIGTLDAGTAQAVNSSVTQAVPAPRQTPAAPAASVGAPATPTPSPSSLPPQSAATPNMPAVGPSSPTPHEGASQASQPAAAGASRPSAPAPPPAVPDAPIGPPAWTDVTMKHVEEDLIFTRLPPDAGVVTPIASLTQEPDPETAMTMQLVGDALPMWPPGHVADPVQRVRNYLFVPAVVDVFQLSSEPFMPLVVFERIQQEFKPDELIKILYWIAVHPDQGDESAVRQLGALGLPNGEGDPAEYRGRAGVYAVKLLGRITGKRAAQ